MGAHVLGAYLVLHIDTTAKPPDIAGAGIYKCPASDLTSDRRSFNVDVCSEICGGGEDFEAAKQRLLKMLRQSPVHGWLVPMLNE